MNIELRNIDNKDYVLKNRDQVCIVTDPPFNIGYHYNSYSDKMQDEEYFKMLSDLFKGGACAIIHYPEALYKLAFTMNTLPERVISWVYNSNTKRQHRDIAFFNVEPDFTLVKQPYKNPTDKRIMERIQNGAEGTNLYDWFYVNQVKNCSKEKTEHPCQMPLEVMLNIVGIIPRDYIIYDPFMGSGTTGVACAILGRNFIGCELDTTYFNIAKYRISHYTNENNIGQSMQAISDKSTAQKRLF